MEVAVQVGFECERTGGIGKIKIFIFERKGFVDRYTNFAEQIVRLHLLRAASKDDAVGLDRNLDGNEEEGFLFCGVDESHRRAGRNAERFAGGIVEGVGGLVLRGDDAHAGIRV